MKFFCITYFYPYFTDEQENVGIKNRPKTHSLVRVANKEYVRYSSLGALNIAITCL